MKLSKERRKDLQRMRRRLVNLNNPIYFQHAINCITRELDDAEDFYSAEGKSVQEAVEEHEREVQRQRAAGRERAKKTGGRKARFQKVI